MSEAWKKPKDVSNFEIAFPAGVMELLPPMEQIPDEFQMGSRNKWNRLVGDMFFKGVMNLQLIPKDGIDSNQAFRVIRTIIGSWEPQHEHKEAGAAYLLSLWFKDASWQ